MKRTKQIGPSAALLYIEFNLYQMSLFSIKLRCVSASSIGSGRHIGIAQGRPSDVNDLGYIPVQSWLENATTNENEIFTYECGDLTPSIVCLRYRLGPGRGLILVTVPPDISLPLCIQYYRIRVLSLCLNPFAFKLLWWNFLVVYYDMILWGLYWKKWKMDCFTSKSYKHKLSHK